MKKTLALLFLWFISQYAHAYELKELNIDVPKAFSLERAETNASTAKFVTRMGLRDEVGISIISSPDLAADFSTDPKWRQAFIYRATSQVVSDYTDNPRNQLIGSIKMMRIDDRPVSTAIIVHIGKAGERSRTQMFNILGDKRIYTVFINMPNDLLDDDFGASEAIMNIRFDS